MDDAPRHHLNDDKEKDETEEEIAHGKKATGPNIPGGLGDVEESHFRSDEENGR
jgi:hypothetical protein